jgi:2-polyprenyl-6-methoxyphenol hydroxylase-like FAD-dependent oxidoreductase
MPALDTAFHDVIIAGAGPVGLFLACELRLAGVSVLVLERAEHPDTPLQTLPFGLRGLSVPTIESLDRRDLLDDLKAHAALREKPATVHWMQQKRSPGGHFAGIQFFHDQIDPARWAYRLTSSTPTTLRMQPSARRWLRKAWARSGTVLK